MSAQPLAKTEFLTAEEYIEREIVSDVKHEYFNGEIFAMAGATASHNDIAASLMISVGTQLRGTPCRPFGSDMRVKVEATGIRTYPDLSIACESRFENERQLDLLNPRVVIEILSPGTAAYDRGEKFRHYRQLSSLQEYILVETQRPHIEQFIRQENGGWLLLEYDGLDKTVQLSSVPCVLELAVVYERITFDEERVNDWHSAENENRVEDED
jgi:Uma2 family endonuclease